MPTIAEMTVCREKCRFRTKSTNRTLSMFYRSCFPHAHPELPNIPLAINQAENDEAKKLIQVGIHDVSTITYLYSLPPGTPKERVQILRKAFVDTMKDPEFLAEAKKANLDLDLETGDKVEKTIANLFKLEPSISNKLREILK